MLRRDVMAGLAMAAAAGEALAQGGIIPFDYYFVRTQPGQRATFMEFSARTLAGLIRAAGGELIGRFTAQLGWDSNELALLIRWRAGGGDPSAVTLALQHAPGVASFERHPLIPTVRPTAESKLESGGIYVHRWFEIKPTDREEFVKLSTEGWQDFEKRFDAKIFGLMAEIQPRPKNTNLWLLLLTRYGSHQVWEASRDPATEGMRAFQRRAQLTLSSRGCSTLLATQ